LVFVGSRVAAEIVLVVSGDEPEKRPPSEKARRA
jgi:hypothetical protein